MRPFPFICSLVFVLSQFSHAATSTTKKTTATAKKSTSKTAAKSTVHHAASTSKTGAHTKTTARSRTSTPPRQQTPSTERYAEIQRALVEKGYFKGEPSGAWGADSVDALKRFQADHKLAPDGKIGALSLIGLGLGPKHEANGEVAVTPKAVEEGKQ